jgi:type I restriction enzyme S subunit
MRFSEIAGNTGIFVDGDWIEKKDQDASGAVRLIQLADVGPGDFRDKSDKHITVEKVAELHCTFLQKGDILIARLGEPLCKACIFPLEGLYITAVDVAVLRIGSKIVNPKYLVYLLNSPWFKDQVKQYESGTTRKRISRKNLDRIETAFPSLPEQERIVARIEALFSQLDAGVETLKKTKAQLAVYRQAVLKEAFDSVEASFYHPFRAAILGSPQNGLYKPKSDYCDNGTPILRIDGFYDGFILSDYYFKRVNLSAEEIERYRLELGDLVVNRVNSMPYLGKCALVRSLIEPTVFESNMMRIKLDTDKVEGDWITYYLSSHGGRKELTKNAKQAVNQASINQTDVGNALVPIPSINEQKRLVTVIESRLSVCDSIEQTVDAALQQAEAMRQSILKDSFEGRL